MSPGRLLAVALLVATGAVPAAAQGPVEPDVGFSIGARLSAAFPMGSVLSDPATGPLLIDELIAVSVPLQLDVGLQVHRRWFVGAYGQYAWSFLQIGQCKVGESCSVTGLRFGLQATYALRDDGGPWVGLGTGLEWMFTSYTYSGVKTNLDVFGWEFAIFQVGWDVEVSPGWMVGPWFSGSIGEFSRASLSVDGRTLGNTIDNKALHGWLQIGVRGSWSL